MRAAWYTARDSVSDSRPPTRTDTGNWVSPPAAAGSSGTSATITVAEALSTVARVSPNRTMSSAAVVEKCRPVRVTASPIRARVGDTLVSSGLARRRSTRAPPPTTRRSAPAPMPTKRGSRGEDKGRAPRAGAGPGRTEAGRVAGGAPERGGVRAGPTGEGREEIGAFGGGATGGGVGAGRCAGAGWRRCHRRWGRRRRRRGLWRCRHDGDGGRRYDGLGRGRSPRAWQRPRKARGLSGAQSPGPARGPGPLRPPRRRSRRARVAAQAGMAVGVRPRPRRRRRRPRREAPRRSRLAGPGEGRRREIVVDHDEVVGGERAGHGRLGFLHEEHLGRDRQRPPKGPAPGSAASRSRGPPAGRARERRLPASSVARPPGGRSGTCLAGCVRPRR